MIFPLEIFMKLIRKLKHTVKAKSAMYFKRMLKKLFLEARYVSAQTHVMN